MAKRNDVAANDRTARGLRDILFDELQELRSPDGDPQRALAVAHLAKQIMNTVKVELDYSREQAAITGRRGAAPIGTLVLGTQGSATSAESPATEP